MRATAAPSSFILEANDFPVGAEAVALQPEHVGFVGGAQNPLGAVRVFREGREDHQFILEA